MEVRRRIVVVGGTAAGPKAAAKARRMDQHAEITIVQREPDLSMATCGYPYYVGGSFDDRNLLLAAPTGALRDPKFFLDVKGIKALVNTEVEAVDPVAHTVLCNNLLTGEMTTHPYDKLVLATGASAVVPPIPGINLKGITTLQSMRDTDYLRQVRDAKAAKKAVVVGGGLIGIEVAEALRLSGIEVTVVEMMPQILAFLDWEIAKLVENHMRAKGVHVATGDRVAEFLGAGERLTAVRLQRGVEMPCDLAVVAVGVQPNVELAVAIGLEVGDCGGICVNEYLQTSEPDIYAAGDCIEVTHLITGKKVLAPFGDLANLQGRVAGQNVIAGNKVTFPGTIQTGVCKVFDFTVGSTGLSEASARRNGYDRIVSMVTAGPDKPHYMKGRLLVVKMVAHAETGHVLGVQCVGAGDASKRIAAAAMAIQGKLTVGDLGNADLPYAPPFSPPIDNLIVAAHCLENKMLGRVHTISSTEFKRKLDAKEGLFVLDVRGPDEYEAMRLGVGEKLIPLGTLRKRVNELPRDKGKEIVCYCKISVRAYEAATFLTANGWTNVRVLEGGLSAWPFEREK